jgi:NADH-quinone oxidoreductase subunit F
MDLHLIPGAVATLDERDAIDAVVDPAIGSRPHARGARHVLLPALHAVHARAGWISEGALNHICERLSVPPAEAYGVASFYSMFSMKPRPTSVAHVCDDIACRVNGAEAVCRDLEGRLGKAGEPGLDGRAMWVRSPCLGQCDRAPAVLFQLAGSEHGDWTLTGATADAIVASLSGEVRLKPDATRTPEVRLKPPFDAAQGVPEALEGPDSTDTAEVVSGFSRIRDLSARTRVYADPPRLLRRVGVADPERLDDYRTHGGYAALRRAFALGPDRVIGEVTDSRLVGRGGALFSTGRKWDAVAHASVRPHYLVCNADESEPGTFKDRVLMEEDPFAVLEAMTIAAYATGCEQGYLYIRGEYPLATARLGGAITQARTRGLLGDNVMGEGVRFDVELRRGAGAYICGEETALFNSIEGLRGEPRNKPPFPAQSGLFGKPTLINNVETLVNVLDIVLEGGQAFAGLGTEVSTGTKLFCVSGCAARPGLYEVPFGVTLRALIDRAGGVRDGRPLQAVLLGGAAGVFVTPDDIDFPLTLEGARAAGATLGSGVVMLFDDRTDLGDITTRIAAFFRHESCGQCVPCRVGTVRQEEALRRLTAGAALGSVETEYALIDDLAQAMRDASICGLGHTASTAVQSAIRKLRVFDKGTTR